MYKRQVYDITSRLEAFSLNTVVSGFMEYTNKLIAIAKQNDGAVDKETIETVTILLAPFVPHIAEEIWEKLGHEDSVFHAPVSYTHLDVYKRQVMTFPGTSSKYGWKLFLEASSALLLKLHKKNRKVWQ